MKHTRLEQCMIAVPASFKILYFEQSDCGIVIWDKKMYETRPSLAHHN